MTIPTEDQIQRALTNVYDYLKRGQDAEVSRVSGSADSEDLAYLSGTFDMRMLVLHALEGALRSET